VTPSIGHLIKNRFSSFSSLNEKSTSTDKTGLHPSLRHNHPRDKPAAVHHSLKPCKAHAREVRAEPNSPRNRSSEWICFMLE